MHHLKEIRLMPYNAEPWETFSDIPPCTNLTKTYLKASKPSDNSVLISDTVFHCTFARLQWNSIPGPIFSVHSTWLWYTIMTKDRLRSKASSQVAMAVVTGINVQDYSLSRMAFMPWVSALDWYDSYYFNKWNILVSSGSSLPCLLSRTTCSASPAASIYYLSDRCAQNGESAHAPFRLSSCKSISNVRDLTENWFKATPSSKALYPRPGNMSPWSQACPQEALTTIMDRTSATGMQPSHCF
jgi:hypothetical protein